MIFSTDIHSLLG